MSSRPFTTKWYMCEMSQFVLGGVAKGHELIQLLLHRAIGSGHSPSLFIILLVQPIHLRKP